MLPAAITSTKNRQPFTTPDEHLRRLIPSYRFYEKAIKVKTDGAAILDSFLVPSSSSAEDLPELLNAMVEKRSG